MSKQLLCGLLIFLGSRSVMSYAAEQERIVLDPLSGNYIISYEYGGQLLQTTYEPPNKIRPVLRSTFKFTSSGDIAYRYQLRNGKESKQRIGVLGVLVSSARGAGISADAPDYLQHQPTAETALALSAASRKVVLSTPEGWHGSVLPGPSGTGLNITWSFRRSYPTDGLSAGRSQSGFGFQSQDLPGVGLAGIRGTTPILTFAGDGPSQEIDDQLSVIEKNTAGVSMPVAIPTFSIPDPFDAAALLSQLQKHAKVDLMEFKLIDIAFATQLDQQFATAIDSAKRSDTVGMRQGINELRRLLAQECQGLDNDEGWVDEVSRIDNQDKRELCRSHIAMLAAKVLDFDLKYVEKRTKNMRDD